jgi:hypothetical protein
MTYTSCKLCTLRRDCWIKNVIDCNRTWRDPIPPTYELVLKASRRECPLYTEEADLDG